MFTGIIQDIGKIKNLSKKGDSIVFNITLSSKGFLNEVRIGDSISVNGACMTIENKKGNTFEFTAIKESLKKTNFGSLQKDGLVNLEKAMTMNTRLDGHIVQGHIDATGVVKKIEQKQNSYEFYIAFPPDFRNNIINVGSIAINGVSLTIADIVKSSAREVLIKVAIIPHTYDATTFRILRVDDRVNMEFDMIGKYVKSILDRNSRNYKNSKNKIKK